MTVLKLKAKQDQQGMGYDAKEDQQHGQVVEMYEGMSYEDEQQKAANATTTTNAIPPFTFEIIEVIEWGGED